MASIIEGNAVIGQSGGPTAVINESLVGVIEGLRKFNAVNKILGMRHGVRGLIEDQLTDLTHVPQDVLDRVARTPSAALGSTRDKPDEAYCRKILSACERRSVRYFFYIGGNDSSDTCRIVNELAKEDNYELRCFHVPKTVDNDLVGSDHTPGYPSAARFVAQAFMADNRDNASIPGIKINVVMGRHAGFLTAASTLARRDPDDGPHLVYLPEVAFDIEAFIDDVATVYDRFGRCQIAVSEGIQDENGQAMGAELISGERDAHGNVQLSGSGALGDALAERIKRSLKTTTGKAPRVRADTFGYLQRCWADASEVDQREARGAGQFAAWCASQGDIDGSVAIERVSTVPYDIEFKRLDLTDVAAKTRHMPEQFIKGRHDVAAAFTEYASPLVGQLPKFGRL